MGGWRGLKGTGELEMDWDVTRLRHVHGAQYESRHASLAASVLSLWHPPQLTDACIQ